MYMVAYIFDVYLESSRVIYLLAETETAIQLTRLARLIIQYQCFK